MVSVAHLCRLAEKIQLLCGSQTGVESTVLRQEANAIYGDEFWAEFKRRFTPQKADELGRRFALMSQRMQADREHSDAHYTQVYRQLTATRSDAAVEKPNFDSRALRTHYHKMPDLTIEELISSR